jgi:very-short-patch-repair endonuclease
MVEKRSYMSQMKNQDDRWTTTPRFWEKLKPKARQMRKKPTEAERRLWSFLRNGRLKKYKFRRQHSLGQFIVDFYCEQANLVIEVDGPIHQQQTEKDSARQEYLENKKYKVLRFPNDYVINSVGDVLTEITSYLEKPQSSPLSASGEGVRG